MTKKARHFSKDIKLTKYMKRSSVSPINREMQIKTTMRHHHTQVRMTIIKMFTNNKCWREWVEMGTLYNVGGKINWYSYYGKSYAGFSDN